MYPINTKVKLIIPGVRGEQRGRIKSLRTGIYPDDTGSGPQSRWWRFFNKPTPGYVVRLDVPIKRPRLHIQPQYETDCVLVAEAALTIIPE